MEQARPTREEMIRAIEDSTLLDSAVFEMLKNYLNDELDANGKVILERRPCEIDMSIIIAEIGVKRPAVRGMLEGYVVLGHWFCCGPGSHSPLCKN